MATNIHQPLRVLVSFRGWTKGRTYKGRGPNAKGAYTAITPNTFGFVAWTEDTAAEPWREGYGSFLFANIHKTRAEVSRHLSDPKVTQVSIRTNQDRHLFVYNRHEDGRVTHYNAQGWE